MNNRKNLLCIIGALVAFAATITAIAVFWDEIYFFVVTVRDKVIKYLDAIAQHTYIDHYDEYEDYSDYMDE